MTSLVPILSWLPSYERAWLRADVMAGLAVWAMTVPQALAYAGIAGVPAIHGLYAVPLAMLAYAIFGTSRTLSVGPESAIAIISAVTVGGLIHESPEEFLATTALLALVVGVLFLLFGLLRLGWVANFLAQPVLQGFTQGIALTVIAGQMPAIFGTEREVTSLVGELRNVPQVIGLDVDYTGILLQAWVVLATLGKALPATTAVGLASLALLFAFRRFRPQAPSALIAVVLAGAAVTFLDLADRGVSVIGEVATGMVSVTLPSVSAQAVLEILPGAFAIVLLGYSVSLSVAAVGAKATGETVDSNQELIALGAGNLAASLSSGFVVCGSLSRGSVIGRAKGQTQMVSLINAGLVVLTLLFALPLFFNLPKATLSAIVIVAMSGLLDFSYFRRLYRIDRSEFVFGAAALAGVLLLGILQGVALGVALALVLLVHRVSRPETAVLGRVEATGAYRDLATHAEAEALEGLLIFRFGAPIIFANCSYFVDRVLRSIADDDAPTREVLICGEQMSTVDSTGADRVEKLLDELERKEIGLSFAGLKSTSRTAIRRTGLEDRIGVDRFHESLEDGVRAFLAR